MLRTLFTLLALTLLAAPSPAQQRFSSDVTFARSIILPGLTVVQRDAMTLVAEGTTVRVTDGPSPGYHVYSAGAWRIDGTISGAVSDVQADIPSRNALTARNGQISYVTDASADPLVTSGAATYVWDGAQWRTLATQGQGLSFTAWTAATVYAAGDVTSAVAPAGHIAAGQPRLWQSNAARTSTATFDLAESGFWTDFGDVPLRDTVQERVFTASVAFDFALVELNAAIPYIVHTTNTATLTVTSTKGTIREIVNGVLTARTSPFTLNPSRTYHVWGGPGTLTYIDMTPGAGGNPLINSNQFTGALATNVNSAAASQAYIDGNDLEFGIVPPVNGTTVAWRVGDEYVDQLTGLRYRATTASTTPPAGAGSVWAVLPGGADTSIYANDGTLAGNRTVTGGSNNFAITGVTNYNLNALGYVTVDSANDIALNAATGSVNVRAGDLVVRGTTATTQGSIFIADDNDSNQFRIRAPDNITANYVITMPPAGPGALGNILVDTDGAGTMAWQAPTGNSIYANDGTLTANRTLTGGAFNLAYAALGSWRVDATGYQLGNGAGGRLPTLNSDGFNTILTLDPVGNMVQISRNTYQSLNAIADPVNGTTTAWLVGQEFINSVTGARFIATTASTDPDAGPAGSVWAALPAQTIPFINSNQFTGALATNVNSAAASQAYIDGNDIQMNPGPPVNGTTVAWSIGNEYVDLISGLRYRASTASTAPPAGAGSVWAVIPGTVPLINSPTYTGALATNTNSALASRQYTDGQTVEFGTGAPVNNTTVAWRVGDEYVDTVTGLRYRATSASANPDISGVPSIWVALPGSATPGIDDVLAQSQALTATRTLDLNGQDLIIGNSTTDSDAATLLWGNAGGPALRAIDVLSLRDLTGAADPVNGTTTAWYVGQIYTNTTTGLTFRASTQSTNPDAAPAGSVWTPMLLAGPPLLDNALFAGATNLNVNSAASTQAYINGQNVEFGTGIPVNGTTIAWRVGDEYYDTTSNVRYRATTASVNPLTSGAGSVWAASPVTLVGATVQQIFQQTSGVFADSASLKSWTDLNAANAFAGPAVSDATTAYFPGQLLFDTANNEVWRATTPSTDPFTAPAGSVWVKVHSSPVRHYVRATAGASFAPVGSSAAIDLIAVDANNTTTGFDLGANTFTAPVTGWYDVSFAVQGTANGAAANDVVIFSSTGTGASPELSTSLDLQFATFGYNANSGGKIHMNAGEGLGWVAQSFNTNAHNVTGAQVSITWEQ